MLLDLFYDVRIGLGLFFGRLEREKKSKSIRAKPNAKESKIHTKERYNSQFPPRPLLLDIFYDVINDFRLFFGRMEGEKKTKWIRARD